MCIYINSGLYLQMYSFLRNTQAIYQIILLLSDKTHLSRAEKIRADSLLQESALLYSSELICEIYVRIDCRWVVVSLSEADLWVGWGCTTLGYVAVGVVLTINRALGGRVAVGVGGCSVDFYTGFSELGGFTLSVNVCCGFIICVWEFILLYFDRLALRCSAICVPLCVGA